MSTHYGWINFFASVEELEKSTFWGTCGFEVLSVLWKICMKAKKGNLKYITPL